MNAYQQIQAICLNLPEAEEMEKWGEPHFCVRGKIFCGYGKNEQGEATIGFKMTLAEAEQRIALDDRFSKAKYVGRYGWVTVVVEFVEDWTEIEALVVDSYRKIAPKTLAKVLTDNHLTS